MSEFFQVGDVYQHIERPEFAWRVDAVFADGRAVLRSQSSTWATTRPLTMREWNGDGGWRRLEGPAQPGKAGRP